MNVSIIVTYRTKKGLETTFHSEEMPVRNAIALAEDLEKTGRRKNITFVDHKDTHWTIKELKKLIAGIQTEPHHVTIYFDGGFDAATKKSGLGCTIYYEQNNKAYRIRKNALVEELDTNNEAEYAALYLGLQEIELLGVQHLPIVIAGDSLVVINQLNGEWPCYEEKLAKWADRIDHMLEQLGIEPEYRIIPRKQNREADQLATQALKGIEINSKSEITSN